MHTTQTPILRSLAPALLLALAAPLSGAAPEDRQALFGETHVHTQLSFDSYIVGNRNGPNEAYLYAKGETLQHPAGFDMKLKTPLDFLAVADHAAYLGMLPAMDDPDSAVADHPISTALRESESASERRQTFVQILGYFRPGAEDDLLDLDIVRSAWQDIVAAAERHNDPGRFTTFSGYEYTASQDLFENLHRNVIFADKAPNQPFSRLDSINPENLWHWMDDLRDQGMDSIAIPHNSNGSDGYMFNSLTHGGDPLTRAYSETRMRNEPVIELTQVKGTSETHPLLSPTDEFANFEIMPHQIASWFPSRPQGSYAREALLNGMQMDTQGLGNPFRFGFIGSSDTHVGAGSFDEDNYWSKVGLVDGVPWLRGSVKLSLLQRIGVWFNNIRISIGRMISPLGDGDPGRPGDDPAPGYLNSRAAYWGASGLAGVWAEENTRPSIFAAFRRKEVFATSGPRILVRFFAGYGLNASLLDDARMVRTAYNRGVPMGGDLRGRSSRSQPGFVAWATQDAGSAPLQRLQIVKGWLDSSDEKHEQVYDIACAGGTAPDSQTHRCPDNNAQVDLETCDYSADTGDASLKAYWKDPDFQADQNAFYYVRVLENPTCRWSTWDAIRGDSAPNPSLLPTIQERAWSSPIWYISPNS